MQGTSESASHREARNTTISAIFKALADPTRREILKLLRGGNLSAGEIADHFPMSKPSLSRHFNVLQAANLMSYTNRTHSSYFANNPSLYCPLVAPVSRPAAV